MPKTKTTKTTKGSTPAKGAKKMTAAEEPPADAPPLSLKDADRGRSAAKGTATRRVRPHDATAWWREIERLASRPATELRSVRSAAGRLLALEPEADAHRAALEQLIADVTAALDQWEASARLTARGEGEKANAATKATPEQSAAEEAPEG